MATSSAGSHGSEGRVSTSTTSPHAVIDRDWLLRTSPIRWVSPLSEVYETLSYYCANVEEMPGIESADHAAFA